MRQVGRTNRRGWALGGFLAVLNLLTLPGCIDDFPVPLDPEPKLKLDQGLIGAWGCFPAQPEIPSDLKAKSSEDDLFPVLKFEESGLWYHIRTLGFDKDKERPWDAFPSKLGNRIVLNAWDVSESPRANGRELALFAYVWLSPDVFSLEIIDPDKLEGKALAPSSALRKTLESRRFDRQVFSPFLVCSRAKVIDPS